MDKRLITPDEAINLLNEDEHIHTFRNPNGMLLGADWNRVGLIERIRANPDKLEIGGDMCRGMKHGLILHDDGILFIETNEEKLNAFDPIIYNEGKP